MSENCKFALVTGAGHGIGRAIALRLAKMGLAVAVHYHHSQREAAAVVAEIKQLGRPAVSIAGDLSRLADIEALFLTLDREFGRLDVLVNNAGVVMPSPMETLNEAIFDKIFAVNLKGTTFVTREALPRMGSGGRIVNITSSRAHFPAAGTTCYAGSKGALEIMTRVWSAELGARGINVNAVAPGPTSPGMIDRAPEFLKAAALKASPMARLGRAEEIANVVAFLCSDESSWVTGQVVLVSGGGNL